MSAHRDPIEIDPAEPIGEAMERAISSTGETELRIGSHLYVVLKRDTETSEPEPAETGNIDKLLKAAREGKGSIDAEAMIARIYEMRDWEAENPRPLPPIE